MDYFLHKLKTDNLNLFSYSAIYMFLMSQSSYTENIGNKIEMLITKIENLENEKRHIDYLTTIEEKKREMEEHSEQRKTILDPLQDNAIDMLANSFDNLEQPIPDNNSLCCMTDEQNSCRKNDQKQVNCDCNCSLSVRNAEYIVAHETLHKKVENSRESTTEEHLSNELQILHDIILEDLSKILDRFDESLRNKLLGQLKQV